MLKAKTERRKRWLALLAIAAALAAGEIWERWVDRKMWEQYWNSLSIGR